MCNHSYYGEIDKTMQRNFITSYNYSIVNYFSMLVHEVPVLTIEGRWKLGFVLLKISIVLTGSRPLHDSGYWVFAHRLPTKKNREHL